MDTTLLEQFITCAIDTVFERLQVKHRVKQVTIRLGVPLGLHVTIDTSDGDPWVVTIEEEDLRGVARDDRLCYGAGKADKP